MPDSIRTDLAGTQRTDTDARVADEEGVAGSARTRADTRIADVTEILGSTRSDKDVRVAQVIDISVQAAADVVARSSVELATAVVGIAQGLKESIATDVL